MAVHVSIKGGEKRVPDFAGWASITRFIRLERGDRLVSPYGDFHYNPYIGIDVEDKGWIGSMAYHVCDTTYCVYRPLKVEEPEPAPERKPIPEARLDAAVNWLDNPVALVALPRDLEAIKVLQPDDDDDDEAPKAEPAPPVDPDSPWLPVPADVPAKSGDLMLYDGFTLEQYLKNPDETRHDMVFGFAGQLAAKIGCKLYRKSELKGDALVAYNARIAAERAERDEKHRLAMIERARVQRLPWYKVTDPDALSRDGDVLIDPARCVSPKWVNRNGDGCINLEERYIGKDIDSLRQSFGKHYVLWRRGDLEPGQEPFYLPGNELYADPLPLP